MVWNHIIILGLNLWQSGARCTLICVQCMNCRGFGGWTPSYTAYPQLIVVLGDWGSSKHTSCIQLSPDAFCQLQSTLKLTSAGVFLYPYERANYSSPRSSWWEGPPVLSKTQLQSFGLQASAIRALLSQPQLIFGNSNTTLVHGPCSRVTLFDAREHGPWSRRVDTERVY